MRHRFRHILFTLIASCPLSAGEWKVPPVSPPDTARIYLYDEIVITAERYPLSAGKAGSVSYAADGTGESPFAGAGSVLSGMRNLHLMSYGGGMALQTLSIRGMGAEHTLLLWNGMPAGNMQTGVADLNLFDASGIGSIQVVPGSASALCGSAAVGGAVNLIPSIPYGGGGSVEVSGAAGSFGETDYSVRGEVSPGTASGISVRAGSRRSSESYPFGGGALPGEEQKRTNADYLGRTLGFAWGWKYSGQGRIGVSLSTISLEQGAPGPWYPGWDPSAARRSDTRTLAGVSLEEHTSDALTITANGLFDAQYERYIDPGPLFPADNYYRTSRSGVTGQVRYRASAEWLLQWGTDLALTRAGGNALDRTRSRGTGAASASASWEARPWEAVTATVTPSLRFEGNSSFDPLFSPKIGVNIEWGDGEASARLHSTAGAGSRIPTMNELYFSGAGGRGNPLLREESSVSIDAGIGGRTSFGGGISLDATLYRIRMTDRIQWAPLPEDPWTWTPVNIGRSLSTGWELGGEWTPLPGEIGIGFNYSLINSKRGDITSDGTMRYDQQLIYVPLNKASVSLLLGRREIAPWLDALTLGVRLNNTGERYTAEDNSASLPAFRTVDATLSAEFPVPGGTAKAVVESFNLGDRDYQVLPGYPMPRFHQRASITYKIRY